MIERYEEIRLGSDSCLDSQGYSIFFFFDRHRQSDPDDSSFSVLAFISRSPFIPLIELQVITIDDER